MRNQLYTILTIIMVFTAISYTSKIYSQSEMNVALFVMWVVGMLLIKLFTPAPHENSNVQSANKRCPHCAEEVMFEAKKCKHCGEQI